MDRRRLKPVRRAVLALGALPLLLKLPYLVRAFRTSPFDRGQLVAWGVAATLAVLAAVPLRRALRVGGESLRLDRILAFVAGAGCAAGFAAGAALGINALQIAAAFGVWWSVAWWFYGRKFALLLLPAVAAGMLALPGAGQWAWGGIKARVAFTAYDPCMPEFAEAKGEGGWIGREMPSDASFAAYFEGAPAKQYRYACGDRIFDVIVFGSEGGVGHIHPPAHCLKSSRWRVEAERLMGETAGGRRLQYSELVASRGVERRLVRAWYSNGEESTGSFVNFRTKCRGGDGWKAYLVSTPVETHEDILEAREMIRELVGLAGE